MTKAQQEKQMVKPIMIKETQRLVNSQELSLVQIWKYKNKTFKFIFTNYNGKPCGFDYKHCVRVFNENSDEWKSLASVDEISSMSNNEYDCDFYSFYNNQSHINRIMRQAELFMKDCAKYIQLIY